MTDGGFISQMAPHLAANLLTVWFVMCALGIYRSEKDGSKGAEYPYYWGGVVVVLLVLIGAMYSQGAVPSGI